MLKKGRWFALVFFFLYVSKRDIALSLSLGLFRNPPCILFAANFWEIASEFTLQEGLLQRPPLARIHFKFVLENLDTLSPNILKVIPRGRKSMRLFA